MSHPGARSYQPGDVDGLIAAKLDRLSCSILDFATLIERAQKNPWSLIALDLGVTREPALARSASPHRDSYYEPRVVDNGHF